MRFGCSDILLSVIFSKEVIPDGQFDVQDNGRQTKLSVAARDPWPRSLFTKQQVVSKNLFNLSINRSRT